MRLLVHTDQVYLRDEDGVSSPRSFVTFLGEVAEHCEALTLVGRLDADPGRAPHPLSERIRFAALPACRSAASPTAVARSAAPSCRVMWRALRDADTVWLLGPTGLSLPFALLATLRGARVRLGVRQDLPAYVRARHPGRRLKHLAADGLEAAFRRLARRRPVVVVGPDLARRYASSEALHETSVSLVRERDVVEEQPAGAGPWPTRFELLTVSRLDPEKNPLLLADVLARLDPRWRLTVCGDGPLRGALTERLEALGLADRAVLLGNVGAQELLARYRRADAFLHVSWTEGLPQVLFEAFASGTPVVATDVGGVRDAAGDAALLVRPGDAGAAATAIERLRDDAGLRARLMAEGLRRARAHTLEAEAAAVAAFLRQDRGRGDACGDVPATREISHRA